MGLTSADTPPDHPMYIPTHFAEDRPEVLQRIIREHPLGVLVTTGPDGLDANHLPFEFDPARGPRGTLVAHVARANDVWRRNPDGAPVLVVFRGVDAYVSPSWYPSKHETHRQVPTWNYEAVHAHGLLTIRDDERFVRGVVARLTRRHEAGEPVPWKMGDAPADHIDQLLTQIVGIEVAVTSLTGKRKLSQNKDPRDLEGAADALSARGADAIADLMREGLVRGPD